MLMMLPPLMLALLRRKASLSVVSTMTPMVLLLIDFTPLTQYKMASTELVGILMLAMLAVVAPLIWASLTSPESATSRTSLSLLLSMSCLIFASQSFLQLFVLIEAASVPMIFIILGWGGQPERITAVLYMLMFTVILAMPLVLISVWLGFSRFGSWEINYLPEAWLMAAPMLIKLPMYFVHLWLPKAHVEAPVYGSMVLASVLLKIAAYGLIRVMSVLNPVWSLTISTLSFLGGALAIFGTLAQPDMKALIAYSSVVHMAPIPITTLMDSYLSKMASCLMLTLHGFVSSGLFLACTLIYTQSGSRMLMLTKGVLLASPHLTMFWVLLILFNSSVPPSLTLLSEILIFNTASTMSSVVCMLVMTVLVMGSLAYSISLYSALCHGQDSASIAYSVPMKALVAVAAHVVVLAASLVIMVLI